MTKEEGSQKKTRELAEQRSEGANIDLVLKPGLGESEKRTTGNRAWIRPLSTLYERTVLLSISLSVYDGPKSSKNRSTYLFSRKSGSSCTEMHGVGTYHLVMKTEDILATWELESWNRPGQGRGGAKEESSKSMALIPNINKLAFSTYQLSESDSTSFLASTCSFCFYDTSRPQGLKA